MTPPDSRHPLRAVARTWWIVPLALGAALLVSFLLTRREKPTYSATTSVIVIPEGTAVESVRDQIDALGNLDRRNVVATIAGIAHGNDVLARAARRAGLDDAAAHRYRVRSIVRPNTNILDIEALGPDPASCALLAHEVASIAGTECTNNYRIYRLRTLDEPEPPTQPISPDLQRNLFVGGVLGLLTGVLLAAAVEWFRRGLAATGS
jgi:uncharacterized protein involved in exopolysaccharide biosynthesis